MSQAGIAEEASRYHRVFQVFREVHKVRDFQLVLQANVWGCVGEYHVRALEQAVAEEKARKGFEDSLSEPLHQQFVESLVIEVLPRQGLITHCNPL